jgi:hypothetical protein
MAVLVSAVLAGALGVLLLPNSPLWAFAFAASWAALAALAAASAALAAAAALLAAAAAAAPAEVLLPEPMFPAPPVLLPPVEDEPPALLDSDFFDVDEVMFPVAATI